MSRALVRELASFFNDLLNEDCPDYWPDTERWAEALIPEIEKRCREAAAEELEEAARNWTDFRLASVQLHDRAAELRNKEQEHG